MEFFEEIYLTKKETDYYRKLLQVEPSCKEECMDEDATICHSVTFNDGMQMDVKICGVQWEENADSNLPWTEAVLFTNAGCEVACSEVSDEIEGDWELNYLGNVYVATVHPYAE